MRASGEPSAPLTPYLVTEGSEAETAWNGLLAEMGYPPLSGIARRGTDDVRSGWLVPFTLPPAPGDQLQFQKAERWISIETEHLLVPEGGYRKSGGRQPTTGGSNQIFARTDLEGGISPHSTAIILNKLASRQS